MSVQPNYPDYLESFSVLRDRFDEEFSRLSSHDRGIRFADFAEVVCPKTPFAAGFEVLERQKISNDGGVDFKAKRKDGAWLCMQAKYSVSGKDDFDTIISKFQNFQAESLDRGLPLFTSSGVSVDETPIYFQIVSMHDLKAIRQRYENSHMASLNFYRELRDRQLLDIFDGPRIFGLLSDAYKKSFVQPTDFELPFATNFIEWMDVYIGVVSGAEIRKLYKRFEEALFFENIRDYVGLSPSDVNKDILNTAQDEPDKMLSRNNGLVLKAGRVEKSKDQPFTLRLFDASIVNGCQTTVTILGAKNVEEVDEKVYVAVKVVKSADGWDVARTANTQNEIGKLELRIAEFIRPQRIKKAAAHRGLGIEDNSSPISVLDPIYQKTVVYEDMRSLFIGLFSSTPNNLFDSDRSGVLDKVLDIFFSEDPEGQQLFEDLFTIQLAANECNKRLKNVADKEFRAFFREGIHNYRAYLVVLATCCACQIDISGTKDKNEQYARRKELLRKAVSIVENDLDLYYFYYWEAFRTIIFVAESAGESLWDRMKRSAFSGLFDKALRSADISRLR